MENLPAFISTIFIITTILTVFFFFHATHRSKKVLILLSAWVILQSLVSLSGFYTVTNHFPPRFILLPIPTLLVIIYLFLTESGKRFIDGLDLKVLHLLHVVRVPVELVLYWLFVYKTIPQLMTFEGRNFDILAGITAPFIFYFGFVNIKLSRKTLLLWNFISVALLANIVINAILSAPFPIQRFAFDQPAIAVLYFPFTLLPGCIVPLVLFSHFASIRQLTNTALNREVIPAI